MKYENAARKESFEKQPEFKQENSSEEKLTKVAMDYLNSNIASQKEWASDLEISPSIVNQWIRGEKALPQSRAAQILAKARFYWNRQQRLISAIEEEALKLKGWF